MGIFDWSTTPSSNATVGSINWAEGQAPSTVNNSSRQEMADVAAWRDLLSAGVATTGSANVYAITTGTSVPSLANGRAIAFRANFSNTGAATLNVDSLGAKSLRYQGGAGDKALYAEAITSGNVYLAVYSESANSAAGGWIVLNPSAEIGTWTPIAGGGTTTTYGAGNTGEYERIGDIVTFAGAIAITSIGDGNTAVIGGLPYSSARDTPISVGIFSTLAQSVYSINAYVSDGNDTIILAALTAAGASVGATSVLGNGTSIQVAGSYIVS